MKLEEVPMSSTNVSHRLPCEIGKNWASAPLKYIAHINPESVSGSEPDDWEIEYVDISSVNSRGEVGNTEIMEYSEAPSRAQRKVREGDTIISTVRTYLKAIAYLSDPNPNVVVSTGFGVLRPGEQIYPPFLWRILQADPFVGWIVANSEGVSYPAIKPSRLGDLVIPIPSIRKQKKICEYLAHKTGNINKLIDKKKNLINLLGEKRQSILNKLEQEEPSRDYVKLKYIADFLSGYAFPSKKFTNNSNDIRLLRGVNVDVRTIDWDETVYWPVDDLNSKYLLEPGDIVLGMDRPWISDGIRVAQLSEADCPALLVQRVLRIRAKEDAYQDYIQMMLESNRFRQYFEPITTGVSVPHISQEQVGNYKIPLPPKPKQEIMLSQWDESEQRLEMLMNMAEESVELLKEKRQALITAAVTGQIDITET